MLTTSPSGFAAAVQLHQITKPTKTEFNTQLCIERGRKEINLVTVSQRTSSKFLNLNFQSVYCFSSPPPRNIPLF